MTREPLNDDSPLPRLREDLRLLAKPKGSFTPTGSLIFDPIAHRYFEIDYEVYQVLAAWGRSKTVRDLRSMVLTTFGQDTTIEDIEALLRFLDESSLLLEAEGGWRSYSARADRAKPGFLTWLLHNYLFIRIPLLKPHAILKATLPYVSFAFTPVFYWAIAAIGLAGLYLVSRQWDEFTASFAPLLTVEGAALFGLALAVVKVFHELGHAYTAMRYGCRIPSMGVALVVMLPMLYTDVTDAWRLPRREKMFIAAGGIIVELCLAALATFAWSFMPDGPARSFIFIIATTSWVTSLAVNLNPLMRFDGYFLFSDWTGVSNLQTRANALGAWRLRELLFNLGAPCPDKMPASTRTWVVGYAWMIWVYRIIVFTGIALTVYHYFFKALGIILFAVEILWFILLPIWRELRHWWRHRDEIKMSRRSRITLAVAIALLGVLIVPWSTRIEVPAIRQSAVYARLFPVSPSIIKEIHVTQGQTVKGGDVLVELEAPRIAQDLKIVDLKLKLLRLRLDRRAADKTDRADSLSIAKEITLLEEQRHGLERQREELIIRAPFSGEVVELNSELKAGRWLSRAEEIALIVAPEHGNIVTGYLSNDALARLEKGAKGRFTPDDPLGIPDEVLVTDIAYSASATVDIPYLASTFGGPVQVLEDKTRGPVPTQAAYLVTLEPEKKDNGLNTVSRGLVVLEAKPESILASVMRHTISVLVRESGA